MKIIAQLGQKCQKIVIFRGGGVPTFKGYVQGGWGDFKNRKKIFFLISNVTTYFETLKHQGFQKKLSCTPP